MTKPVHDGADGRDRWVLLPLIVAVAACLCSSAIWVLTDRHVWPWDQALYGQESLELGLAADDGIGSWIGAMITSVGFKPPLLVWLGQALLPFRNIAGGVEPALLMANILGAAATLWLVYATCRRMGIRRLESAAGVVCLAGASLFVGMTHQYMVEIVQSLVTIATALVAFEAARQPLMRTVCSVVIVVGLGLLVKASTLTFIVPLMVYAVVAVIATQGRRQRTFNRFDAGLAALALLVLVAGTAWYAVNWTEVIRHAIGATLADDAELYGSKSGLAAKLVFWTTAIGRAISPFLELGIAMAVLAAVAFAAVLWRLARIPVREWIVRIVDDGSLFAAALAGTIVAQILVYSLQINEETRFLTPVLPLVAVLVAWALARIGQTALTLIAVATFAANGVLGHAYAHGYGPMSLIASPWLLPAKPDTTDMTLLEEVVASTCDPASPQRISVIGVDYPNLSANSAQFYAAKIAGNGSPICLYTSLGYAEADAERAWQRLFDLDVGSVVTLTPDAIREDPFNLTVPAIAARLAISPEFALAATIGGHILVYRLAGN